MNRPRINTTESYDRARKAFLSVCLRIATNDPTLVELDEWTEHHNVSHYYKWTDKDLYVLGKSLAKNTHLKRIRFFESSSLNTNDERDVSLHGGGALCDGIAQSQLETIIFLNNPSPRLQQFIHAGAKMSSTIRALKFLDTVVNTRTLALAIMMPANKPRTMTTTTITSPPQPSLTPASTGQITLLALARCKLTDMDLLTLSLGLAENHTVKYLDVMQNAITNIGVMYFCQHWKDDSPIYYVDMLSNRIDTNGALLLLQAATHHPALTSLKLGYNIGIGHEGIRRLSEQLPQSRLVNFDIANCAGNTAETASNVTPESQMAAQALADGIRGNTSLVELSAGANNLGVKGVSLLLQAIAVHPRLEQLTLQHDRSIGWKGLQQIGIHLPHTRLTQLLLDGVVEAWPDPETKAARKAGQALLNGVQNHVQLEQFSFQELHPRWMEPIQAHVDVNATCRPLLRHDAITAAVWPHILVQFDRVDKKHRIYFCLREQPWLVVRRGTEE